VLRSIRSLCALMLLDRGDVDAAGSVAAGADGGVAVARPLAVLAQARAERRRGNAEPARSRLAATIAALLEAGQYPWYSLLAEELVALELEAGDRPAAVEVARRTQEWVQPARSELLDLFALRSLGATGDLGAAQRAAAIAQDEGMPVEVAKSQLLLAELGDDPVDHALAAYEGFVAVEALPWIRRANAVLRRHGRGAPRRRALDEGALTATERELTRLVVEGLSNREVAVALNYSAKTVEIYLSRVYAKTRSAGRVELVRRVLNGEISLEGGSDR
jgi:DNA-binding CsgD family transcriptional regulator